MKTEQQDGCERVVPDVDAEVSMWNSGHGVGISEERQRVTGILKEKADMRKEADDLAAFLHNNYEIISQHKGWQTQISCRTSFDDLPSKNKEVMREVCKLIRKRICEEVMEEIWGVKPI